ncbi:uncharacterized protein PADG_01374 [Paracoccidioides brasiliensis Pb18]|uniref:Pentatricopeptide repeat protein n=1 Tax=Paracoccidioides brasiliensis (strain Pb18) TaxID=502780 RepID=C1G358_PARBD|nr:uncharacterized protein PADG_01374 [Paracoccidioides brasiliensis Pb18]EEH45224.1 hypothetical protein PADG_01374 [Paracoccidioides brasiliensis Pb18]
MLRCRNVYASGTLATRLVCNGSSIISGNIRGGSLANHITRNGADYRNISTSRFGKRSSDARQGGLRSRSDSPTSKSSWKNTSYNKPNSGGETKDEELVAADFVRHSRAGAGRKSKPGSVWKQKVIGRSTMSRKAIDIELQWATDRVILAKRVKQMLNKGDLQKALALVRTAQSRGYDCMGAWNMIFDCEMKNDRPVAAFKLYNDMKRRGCKPNTYTYTIMFRGLANSSSKKAVQMALSICNSLRSPRSGVKPSIHHINAALCVCARHGNMDALWEVAGSLPEQGEDAPDARTFTIILNGLQARVASEIKPLDPRSQEDGIIEKKTALVREGKRIWANIMDRWKKGELLIDQNLVSAMGHLLLFGQKRRDCLDVFALLHQSMRVPLLEDLETQLEESRNKEQKKFTNQDTPEMVQAQDESSSTETQGMEKKSTDNDETDHASEGNPKQLSEEPGAVHEAPGLPAEEPEPPSEAEEFKNLFNPLPIVHLGKKDRRFRKSRRAKMALPRPVNAQLSLILAASRTIPNGVAIGRAYWEKLVHGRKIRPDEHSFHEYLRLLRVGRSSSESLHVIKKQMLPRNMVSRKTFVIALSCCSRDRKNPHVFETASRLVGFMDTALMQPEPEILSRYLALIRYGISEESVKETISILAGKEDAKSPDTLIKKRITDAIATLRPHVDKIISLLAYNSLSKHGEEVDEPARVKAASERVARGSWLLSLRDLPSFEESVYLLKQYKQLHDMLLKERTLSDEERTVFETENRRLKKILSRGPVG